MDNSFNPDEFIRRIGQRLVSEFRDAKAGTTPSTVGSAMEQPVRDQLEQILPRGVAVGEGFVIDSHGGTSQQQDVILYEHDICPVFSINKTPQTTYYPCEGVIAVGEIKSRLDRNSLEDAFEKIASVKALRRHTVADFMPHPTTGEQIPLKRNYLSPHGNSSIILVNEGPEQEERHQVFGFVLAGESRLKRDSLLARFTELSVGMDESLVPNLLLTLDGHVVNWGKIARRKRKEMRKSADGTYGMTVHEDGPTGWQSSWSPATATHIGGSKQSDTFRVLIRWIKQAIEVGKTSHIRSFDRYFETGSTGQPTSWTYIPKQDSVIQRKRD